MKMYLNNFILLMCIPCHVKSTHWESGISIHVFHMNGLCNIRTAVLLVLLLWGTMMSSDDDDVQYECMSSKESACTRAASAHARAHHKKFTGFCLVQLSLLSHT